MSCRKRDRVVYIFLPIANTYWACNILFANKWFNSYGKGLISTFRGATIINSINYKVIRGASSLVATGSPTKLRCNCSCIRFGRKCSYRARPTRGTKNISSTTNGYSLRLTIIINIIISRLNVEANSISCLYCFVNEPVVGAMLGLSFGLQFTTII